MNLPWPCPWNPLLRLRPLRKPPSRLSLRVPPRRGSLCFNGNGCCLRFQTACARALSTPNGFPSTFQRFRCTLLHFRCPFLETGAYALFPTSGCTLATATGHESDGDWDKDMNESEEESEGGHQWQVWPCHLSQDWQGFLASSGYANFKST